MKPQVNRVSLFVGAEKLISRLLDFSLLSKLFQSKFPLFAKFRESNSKATFVCLEKAKKQKVEASIATTTTTTQDSKHFKRHFSPHAILTKQTIGWPCQACRLFGSCRANWQANGAKLASLPNSQQIIIATTKKRKVE